MIVERRRNWGLNTLSFSERYANWEGGVVHMSVPRAIGKMKTMSNCIHRYTQYKIVSEKWFDGYSR